MNEAEFEGGDVVTFHAYSDLKVPAIVKRVTVDYKNDIFYTLGGKHLNSKTSGRSIMESKHFKCPKEHPFKW